jgi:hypothetical protein
MIVDIATGQVEDREPEKPSGRKNPAAVELGRLGGLKGGAAGARKLSAAKPRGIARKAAESRWKK